MSLLRSVTTVGGFTMLSRVLGFVRDVLTAHFLGAGAVADAVFVAQRLPNMFRSLFAEGAFSAAFVPLFAGTIATEGKKAARRFAEDVLAVWLVALLAFVVLGEMFMPSVVDLIASGFAADREKFDLTVELTRITFPYLLFISLVALQGGVLNSVERFAAVAATPILLNVFLIAALELGGRFGASMGHAFAWGCTAAGFAQFAWLMVSCRQAGMALSLPMPRLTPAVRRMLMVMLPGVFGAGVTQINQLVSTQIASHLGTGAVSYLYYADRLNQLPLGVVGIAVGTAILPPLSKQIRGGDAVGASHTQNRGIELAFLLTLPAAVALGIAAEPILTVLFQRGAFGPEDAHATALALAAYAAGLPAFVLVKVLVPGFFARHDTKTPVWIGAVAMAVNAALAVMLMAPLAHVGNALALSVAGWVNALLLAWLLHRRRHFAFDDRCRRSLPRIIAAALGMGIALLAVERLLGPAFAGGLAVRIGALAALVTVGLVVYGMLAVALGVADLGDLRRRFRRRTT
jgi:putative peptidoglycan lipid II flippase